MYVRLGLVPTIIASSADAAEKVLKTYDHILASRPHHEASQYLAYGQKNMAFAKYGVYWRNMRKLCTLHLLSNRKINSLQSMRKQEVQSGEAKFQLDRTAMDTTASSTEWILTELLRHPQVMKKLQKELQEVVGLEIMVEESNLENLNRRTVATIDFRGRNFQLVPFGSGRRSCPGMQLAATVVRLMVAQLVHCFEWELPNGMQPCDLDIDEKFGLVTCREMPLLAIPTYRLKK
ncbi:hypothetical protein MTR67_019646 [Solanum verrucosum]|uniref:Cytochrome P450 n=1 Tax=Solanum verrucosum TaxID=315347 RepID=A0AAF0QT87_SOLVR|nr:hypothetical protein MTR67_019646 [Solanum verrucosum]